jgi:V8-like Glu-specific endopeptidase
MSDSYAGTRADIKEIEQLTEDGQYTLAREKLGFLQKRKPKKDFSELRLLIDKTERHSFYSKYSAASPFNLSERLRLLDKVLSIRLPDSAEVDRLLRADREKLVASEAELKTQIAKVRRGVQARRYADLQTAMAQLTPYCEYYPDDFAAISAAIDSSGDKSFEALAVQMACPGSMGDPSNKKKVTTLITRTEKQVAGSPFLILLNQIGDHFGVTTQQPAAHILIASDVGSDTREILYSRIMSVLQYRGYTVSKKATSQDALLVLASFSRPNVSVKRSNFRKVQSAYLAGTRRMPNPAYQYAAIAYQQANMEVNRIIALSQTNPYAGFAMPRARKNLNRAAQELASTPQYIDQDVHENYSFTEFDETYEYQGKWTVRIVLPRYGMEFANSGTTRKSLTRVGQKGMHENDVRRIPSQYSGPDEEENVIREGMTESADTIAQLMSTPFVWRYVGDKNVAKQAIMAKQFLSRMYKTTSAFPVRETLQDVTKLKPLPEAKREEMVRALLAEFSPSQRRTTVASVTGKEKSSIQNTVGNIYERVLPSIVTVITESGHGSGFFITDKIVVTNFHVISGENFVRIILQDKREILGQVENFDPDLDLAFIEVLGERMPPPLALSSTPPRVGERVLAIGSPLKLEGTLTDGLVSALRETENGVWIQTNAALNPGNSGGPLLNMQGEVIGINTLKLVKEDIEGLGFAVSAEEVKRLLGRE